MIVLIKLKENNNKYKPAAYVIAGPSLVLLATKIEHADIIKYRIHLPDSFGHSFGIHDHDIEEVYSLDYAKANYPELLL